MFGGVFTPCTLTILGVIMFLRFGQVVGQSGIINAIADRLGCENDHDADDAFALGDRDQHASQRRRCVLSDQPQPGSRIRRRDRCAVLFGPGDLGGDVHHRFHRSLRRHLSRLVPTLHDNCNAGESGYVRLRLHRSRLDASKSSISFSRSWSRRSVRSTSGQSATSIHEYLQANLSSKFAEGENWFTMFALFFPAVTGIMAGANMSGDLANPSKSIPKGTLLAIGVTAVIYLSQAVLLGCARPAEELISNNMVIRDIAVWPIAITAGVFAATLSSALGSMMGAPRILQAFARDDIFSSLKFFGAGSGASNEPRRATVLTFVIAQVCIAAWRSERDRTDHHHVFHDYVRPVEHGHVLRGRHQEPQLSANVSDTATGSHRCWARSAAWP